MNRMLNVATILILVLLLAGNSGAGLYNDNDFDGADLAVFMAAFGSGAGSPSYNSETDFADDGDVDSIDLSLFAAMFGRTDCELAERRKSGIHPGRIRLNFLDIKKAAEPGKKIAP